MKYDLKAMNFKPDEVNLAYAFTWSVTPEGAGYWRMQYKHGLTAEGQAKWDEMKQQWNEENGVAQETGTLAELDIKPGDVVEWIGYDHIGPHTLDFIADDGCYVFDTEKGPFTHGPDDPSFRIVSRATITPPQRYVVVTDDETVICNRAEAEDICAGGFDAVYKLGDKVEVSIKVEFDV